MPISKPKLGFIGLGIMGRPMAVNLVKAGYPLSIYARKPEAATPLTDAGAKRYSSAAELAETSDIVFTMVSDTLDVEEVITGEQGVGSGAQLGSVVVDMSTISPAATRKIAAELLASGVHMLDAPVSGGEQGAIDGNLSIMVGGKPEVFARVRPLFECMGKNTVHVGGHGAGQVAKACNQVLVVQTITAVAEALLLAKASGANPERVREALLGGFAYSRILDLHGQRMLDNNYKPGFKSKLHLKDMRIALNAAREAHIDLPGAARTTANLDELIEAGGGELDSAAIARVVWGREKLN
jgi:2-hydroxy-3-oxopropionate reductase